MLHHEYTGSKKGLCLGLCGPKSLQIGVKTCKGHVALHCFGEPVVAGSATPWRGVERPIVPGTFNGT